MPSPLEWSREIESLFWSNVAELIRDDPRTDWSENLSLGYPFEIIREQVIAKGLADFSVGYDHPEYGHLSADEKVRRTGRKGRVSPRGVAPETEIIMAQLELFDQPAERGEVMRESLGVPGLTYCRHLLGAAEQQQILAEVDARPWLNDLKRGVQHYGYKYDYKARAINHSMYVGPLPSFALEVANRLRSQKLIEEMPDQMIVNEYRLGQGITAHIDCEPCFKNTIVTVSLGSACVMDFICVATKDIKSVKLEPGSALVLRDKARYEWMHRIQARKSDSGVRRDRRVSLTFRNVILNT